MLASVSCTLRTTLALGILLSYQISTSGWGLRTFDILFPSEESRNLPKSEIVLSPVSPLPLGALQIRAVRHGGAEEEREKEKGWRKLRWATRDEGLPEPK
eukprot:233264-Rhodomonas_salina.1